MITLYIIRHGQCESGPPGFIQGQSDSPLTELGRKQAQAIADRLADERFAAIYSSDLSRAHDTALAIAARHGMPIERTELVRECCLGVAQGLTSTEFAIRYPRDYKLWREDAVANRPTGAERFEEVIARCGRFIDTVLDRHSDGDKIVVVGHIGSVNGLICSTFDLPVRFYFGMHVENTSLTVLEVGDKPMLRVLNDHCHLAGLP